jgi:hypothetical protein
MQRLMPYVAVGVTVEDTGTGIRVSSDGKLFLTISTAPLSRFCFNACRQFKRMLHGLMAQAC